MGTMATVGRSHAVMCVVQPASNGLTYQWNKGDNIIEPPMESNTLGFSSVGVDDAGNDYHCVVFDMGGSMIIDLVWTLSVTSELILLLILPDNYFT